MPKPSELTPQQIKDAADRAEGKKPAKHAGGRPTSYRPEFVEQARKLCLLGAIDREVADFFDVTVSTLFKWKGEYPKFSEALRVGKEQADNRVERSLYQRALGYQHEAVKIFMPAGAEEPVYAKYTEHFPPDTTSCIFWLKNRRPDLWRDTQRHELTGKDAAPLFPEVTDEQRAQALLVFLAKTKQPEEKTDEEKLH